MKRTPDPIVKAAEAMPAKERRESRSPSPKSRGMSLEKWRRRNPVCWKSKRSAEDPRQIGW